MKKNIFIGLSCVIALAGCSTIHFDKGQQELSAQKHEQWHHNFAFALYEGSPVVNLKKECSNGKWASVKTETTFMNGLAGNVVNLVGPIWYPETVEISCN